MEIINKKALLKVLNKNCKNPKIPSYSHVVLDNKIYTLVNPPQINSEVQEKTYLEFEVIISGKVFQEKGHMPNPMIEVDVLKFYELNFIKTIT